MRLVVFGATGLTGGLVVSQALEQGHEVTFLRWLLPIIEDKERMEEALRASSVEWVSVRLPNIVEGPEKSLRISKDGQGIGLSVTASSTARFLLEQITSSDWVRSAPSISN